MNSKTFHYLQRIVLILAGIFLLADILNHGFVEVTTAQYKDALHLATWLFICIKLFLGRLEWWYLDSRKDKESNLVLYYFNAAILISSVILLGVFLFTIIFKFPF